MNYVADCAARQCCPFLKLINEPFRELDIRKWRQGGRVLTINVVFHLKDNCCKNKNNPITTGLVGLCRNRHSKITKEQCQNMWWYSQIFLFLLSFLTFLSTWHKRKHPTLFLESKLRIILHLNNVNKQTNKRAFQRIKTKLIKLCYKVKNKIQKENNDKSILQKEDPYNRLCKLFKRKRKTIKMLNTERQPWVHQWQFKSILHQIAVTLMIPLNTQLFVLEQSVVCHNTNCWDLH